MKRILIAGILAAATWAALALPTVDAVQAEVQRGNYGAAETMMQEVVAAKPGSARAQYVYAEILAHNQRFEAAERALQRAKQIDPQTSYTQADKLVAFEQKLERARQAAAAPVRSVVTPAATTAAIVAPATVSNDAAERSATAPASESGGVPGWAWGLGGAAVGYGLWRLMASRSQASNQARTAGPMGMPMAAGAGPAGAYAPGYGGGQANVPGYGPGYGGGMPQQGRGGGLLGTGLAVAGGVAAGMLAEKMLHGDHGGGVDGNSGGHAAGASSSGQSGLVPGMFDDAGAGSAAADLARQPVDFGSGDGWGSNDAGSGSFDSGGDSGGDGGGW